MKDLIKIEKKTIGEDEINAVDARELHGFLEVETRFNDWVTRRIREYDFKQGVDFITILNSEYSPPRKDYTLSIDMAKELSMVERNEKGKQARRYFIEVQNKAEKIIDSIESIDYKGNIEGIVFSRGGIGRTSSLLIAEKFDKRHADIIRAIENVIYHDSNDSAVDDFNQRNFAQVDYVAKNGEMKKSYELTEQGFSFIALGFTGAKANRFKIDFINAFFKIREALMNRVKAEMVRSVMPEVECKRQFVYIIGNSDNDYLKIGVAKDVEKRIKQLQTGSWCKLTVLYRSMVCSNAFNIETAVHNKIKAKCVNGEWYDIDFNEAVTLIENENHTLKTEFKNAYYGDEFFEV